MRYQNVQAGCKIVNSIYAFKNKKLTDENMIINSTFFSLQ